MIALLLGVALAGEPAADVQPVLSLGYDTVTNDPFIFRRGARVAAALDLGRWVGVELSGGGYPVLGRGDYNAVTRRMVDELHTYPDISRIVASGRLGLLAWPLRSTLGRTWTRLGAGGGAALHHTLDDLEALSLEHPTPYTSQVHPGVYAEVRAEVWHGPVGLRVRLETSWYREAIDAESREHKYPTWLGVDVGWRPGGGG